MHTIEALTPDRIMQFAWGYAPTLIIEAAVRTGVFDRLDEGPRSLPELAAKTGASARGLTAILNALVGLKLLARVDDRYALTAESAAFLVSSKPGYRGLFFQHHTGQLLPQWMHLAEVVRTGKPVARTNHEDEGAGHYAQFVESLFPVSFAAAHALGEHLGLAKASAPVSVLDIGAGSGVWGIALARQSAQVTVRAVDWPRVLEVTKSVAARHGVAERLTVVPGDFHEADFGQRHQIAVLGHILHSEGRDCCRRLLRKTLAALAPGGTLAIQEFVPNDDRTAPPLALLFAVNMLVNTEAGDTYTYAELSAWLLEAGFSNPRRLEVPGPFPLVLADKPAA
jgi:methylase of polypeptide subunit release factors